MATAVRSVPSVIDPRSYVPKYRQLADSLRARIVDGTFAPGELLPAEPRIASEYGVGRDTVRDAIAVLRGEGIVETIPSRGTRVRPEPELTEYSLQRSSRIRIRMPTPEERAEHDIAEGVPVAIIRYGAKTILLVGDRDEMVVK